MERQLSEIVQGLAEIQHLDDLLPYVLEAATEMFAADRAMFAVYDQEGRVRRSTRFNMKVGPDGRLPVSEKLIQQVLRGDRAVIIDDIFKHIDLASRDSVKMNDIRFVVAAQIKVGGTVSGILYIDKLHTPGPGHTEEQQSSLIKLLASSVSLAMRNLQAVEKQKYQSLFTASVIHNTRNNLHVMRANMDLLKRLTLGQNVDEVIDTTVASLESLQTFATSVLRLYELEATRTSPLIWIDPSVELEQRAASLELYARSITDQPIQIELSEVSMILTDAARFGIIIDELLLNAVRYTRVQQPVVISVSRSENPRVPPIHETIDPPLHPVPPLRATADASYVQFAVSNANENARLSDEQQVDIFKPFTRGDSNSKSSGFGLGLSVVQELVTSLGGSIWVESTDTATTFYFDLPTQVEPVEDA